MHRVKKILPYLLVVVAAGATTAQGSAENRIDVMPGDAPGLAAYGSQTIAVRTLQFVNSNQIDMKKIDPTLPKPFPWPRYHRPLTVEVWYPADRNATGSSTLNAIIRNKIEVALQGKTIRDAAPAKNVGALPLVFPSFNIPNGRCRSRPYTERRMSRVDSAIT